MEPMLVCVIAQYCTRPNLFCVTESERPKLTKAVHMTARPARHIRAVRLRRIRGPPSNPTPRPTALKSGKEKNSPCSASVLRLGTCD
jgi:hypothetical protein